MCFEGKAVKEDSLCAMKIIFFLFFPILKTIRYFVKLKNVQFSENNGRVTENNDCTVLEECIY